jgi:hypothetical protein
MPTSAHPSHPDPLILGSRITGLSHALAPGPTYAPQKGIPTNTRAKLTRMFGVKASTEQHLGVLEVAYIPAVFRQPHRSYTVISLVLMFSVSVG